MSEREGQEPINLAIAVGCTTLRKGLTGANRLLDSLNLLLWQMPIVSHVHAMKQIVDALYECSREHDAALHQIEAANGGDAQEENSSSRPEDVRGDDVI